MIYFFVFLSILLLFYLIYLHYQIKKITEKLAHINSIQTNAVIDLKTINPFLLKLSKEISRLIKLNKASYQELVETQQQFDMAINNISHDIRTPLTVASGYTQLLEKQADNSEQQLIKKIKSNLNDVEKKLEDLLTYNRLLEQRIEANLEEINLSSFLENRILTYYDAFQKQDINLHLTIQKNITLISDPELINRIIENALGNILNHGITNGEVKLSQNEQLITLTFTNKTKQAISDYEKLFNRFYTEDLARVNKNSGLGLYIIKELTTLLNGAVYATGNEETFNLVIEFPIK